ncbi:Metallo-hydrolase/oxidoreductase [Lentinula aff. detonsa]|nr:Metallo-hydrolase/oxidoreductase [Lentinula aff. detonsa]
MDTPWKHYKADVDSADIYAFIEPVTSTCAVRQYIIVDLNTREVAVIDPVLDYKTASGTLSTTAADILLKLVKEKELNVVRILSHWIVKRHAHADPHFAPVYGLEPTDFVKSFDIFLKDEEEFSLSHTPDHIGYMVWKPVFTGDSIFMPELVSARADCPGGNAKDLFAVFNDSSASLATRLLLVGHDYPFREARDKVQGAPKLLHSSLQVNIRAGKLPPASNGPQSATAG